MLGSPILDVAIGMTFVFLTLSLIASAIQEILSSLVQSRSANLLNGIRSLFSGDVDLLKKLYNHGIIAGLYKDPVHDFAGKGTSSLTKLRGFLQPILGIPFIGVDHSDIGIADPLLLPAYIPARAFALTMIDILNEDHAANQVMTTLLVRLNDKIKACDENKVDCRVYVALRSLAIRAGNDVSLFQTGLEDWYSDAMDRVSGWYKKYTQNILLVVGLILAIVLNVDSIRVAETLWFNQDARQGLVAAAGDYLNQHPGAPDSNKSSSSQTTPATTTPPDTTASTPVAAGQTAAVSPAPATATSPDFGALKDRLNQTVQTFNQVSASNLLPVGWHHPFSEYRDSFTSSPGRSSLLLLKASLGWILTAIALSLGAPFWFDLLNKFMVVRSTVKPQEKSQTDKTKDNG